MYKSKFNKYAKNNKNPAGKLTTTQTDPGVLGNIDINALDNLEVETPKRAVYKNLNSYLIIILQVYYAFSAYSPV